MAAPASRSRHRATPNDNATLLKFAKAVRSIDPNAMGEPIAVQESGNTVVRAFIEAGLWALISISMLLFIVLRRISDVAVDLGSVAAGGRRHARNHGPDRPAVEFCEYYRAAAPSRSRGGLQDLFRDGMAGGDHQSSAIEPHARRLFQRDDHRDRVRQSLDVQASGHIQHGQSFLPCRLSAPWRRRFCSSPR